MTWSGRKVTNARARWRPVVEAGEAICWRCRRVIVPDPTRRDGGWHVGHVEDRALGGALGPTNQAPEHADCNLKAGGRLGAAITNARRNPSPTSTTPRPRMTPEPNRRIRPR